MNGILAIQSRLTNFILFAVEAPKMLISMVYILWSYVQKFYITLQLHNCKSISFRSSHPEVFCEKGVLRNFTKFTGKHLCQSLFSNKVAEIKILIKQLY